MRPSIKEGNALRYWLFGDAIVNFETQSSQRLLVIAHLTESLARDVKYSKSMIDLCRRFRLKLPDPAQIDPRLPFSAYHRSGFNVERAQAYHAQKHPNR